MEFSFVVVRRPSPRKTSEVNPGYKLTTKDQVDVALIHSLNLWSNTAIGEAFDIDRSRVVRIRAKHVILRRTDLA